MGTPPFAISFISPFGKGKKFKLPLPRDALCQIWLKIGPVVLEKRFKKTFLNVISLFCYHLSLEKGVTLLLIKVDSLLPKDDFCQVCHYIGL